MGKDSLSVKDTQNRIILLCWLVYSSAYFGRYSFSSGINSIIGNYNVTKAETGLVMTGFFIAYGIGQVINGFLCKRYSSHFIFPIALGSSSVINLIIFVLIKANCIGEYFFLVKYIWLLNGVFQSLIWTSIIYILGKNIEQANLGKATAVIGTSVPAGTVMAYSISSFLEEEGLFEWSYVLAALTMTAVAVLWLVFFKPHQRKDINKALKNESERRHKGIGVSTLIILSGLSVFAIANNLIRDGLQTWIPTILKEIYNFSNARSLILATSIYIFGISGVFIVKKLNQTIKDQIVLTSVFFIAISVFTGIILLLINVSAIPVILFFVFIMICGYGVNNIVTSLAPLVLREEINPGVTAGVLDGFCYAGSAISGYTLGIVADKHGWSAVILLLLIIAVCATATAIMLKSFPHKKK